MKYSLITVTNGNFSVAGEYGDNKQAAFGAFHNTCAALWNAPDVVTAMVKVMDENLDCVEGKMEYISHITEEDGPIEK